MAHKEQRDFCIKVKEKFPEFFKNKRVLDIGSLDINGSNRDLFENCNYLGLDVGEGRNVDVVCVGHLFDGPDNYFDTIISTEVFEHDMYYEETIKNIMRMLKPGGLFLFTCAAPGRPEHGTRRQGEWCAPLLLQISEEWADYYKNLTEDDVREISNFNETFPDCYFEFNNIYLEIPADLYFYGIKGGEKYLTNQIVPSFNKESFNDHIFVIDCWPDNESKENDMLSLIKILKTYNIPILLTGHYPIKPEIQKMVDYYLYDKNNPLLLSEEFDSHSVASGRWTEMSDYIVENAMEFHHDYAIWETMRNAFNFCKYLNKKYIHFLEYDNIPDVVQYRQSFIERIHEFDAVLYEYTVGSSKSAHLNPYCSTFIFSIQTDTAIKTIEQINSKFEYFTNKPKGWQLERVFLDCLKKVTNNIHISDYIANNNELNTQAVWNRDGVSRNGAIFQPYLAGEHGGQLYLHLISGFYDTEAKKDYLLEIDYDNFRSIVTLKKNEYMNIHLGKYQKGKRVKLYYQGVNVFNEFLGYDFENFWTINKIRFKDKHYGERVPSSVNINFIDGAYLQIMDSEDVRYDITFKNKKTNTDVYSPIIKGGWWCKSSISYYVDWRISIKSDLFLRYYDLDLNNKNVLISFESKSLGDNLAWIAYVEKFRVEKNCRIICSTFFNDLFKNQYPEIQFVNPGVSVDNISALYRIGLFYKDGEYDTMRHPSNPIKEPLTKVASDILGLEYEELRPSVPQLGINKKKRVCIAIHSTAQCKYWNNPTGWQEVTDYLVSKGYEVRLLSREENGYMGNRNPVGVVQQPESSIYEILKTIQESELFIGISSGLSWLSWASGTPTILISGFTDDYLEPKKGINRVINKNVCNSCWHEHKFNPGDWNWCPVHTGTDRQFECSKTIQSSDVIKQIESILS
jgi:autotransporter strand-loop-strand O-heptosyltransferase